MIPTKPLINVMERAARKAARSLLHDFGEIEQLQASRRGPHDFAVQAHRRANSILVDELQRARPGFGLGSTDSDTSEAEANWVLAPIDGLLNFLHAIPHFAITIAVERLGKPVCGLIHDPIRGELFRAEQGEGAYLNQHRLRVSERDRLDNAVLATIGASGGHSRSAAQAMRTAAFSKAAGIRQPGAASLDLAYVAAGRFEGFWHPALARTAVAAGIVIVREAGGMVDCQASDGSFQDGSTLIASNQRLHDDIRRMLHEARTETGSRSGGTQVGAD